MEVSAAALFFLILAAALGRPAHGAPAHALTAHESQINELRLEIPDLRTDMHGHGLSRPTDCCLSYTPRKIRCVFMETYFETTSGCSQPGVVFTTKRGQHVCANPSDGGVQNCLEDLVKKIQY